MVSATQLQFLVSGNNQFSRVNVSRSTAGEAVKEAQELVGRGYMDVRICTPRGQIVLPDEFDQLDGLAPRRKPGSKVNGDTTCEVRDERQTAEDGL